MAQKSTLSMWTPVRIVYKDNFKNFFQMAMLFVAHVGLFQDSYILRETTSSQPTLLQSRYFSRVTSSTQQVLFQSSCFFRAATFSKQLLFQNTPFFLAIILSKQLLIRSNKLLPVSYFLRIVLQGRQFFRIATQEDKFAQNIDIYRRVSFSKQKFPQNT